MVRRKVLAMSLVLAAMSLVYLNSHNINYETSQTIGYSLLTISGIEGFDEGSFISLSLGMLIQYTVLVLVIYTFFRSIVKSFEPHNKKER